MVRCVLRATAIDQTFKARAAREKGSAPATLLAVVPAMVLGAGLGTRLRPLSDRCAKALVPVGDRPMLGHVLDRLLVGGSRRVVVNAHHRAPDIRAFVEACAHPVGVSEESELLGTAGGLAKAATALGAGDVLVWNADTFADVDAESLVRAHADGAGAHATLALRELGRGEGNVGIDASGRIVRLRSTSVAPEVRGGEFVCVHVLGTALRAGLPPRGCLVGDVYIPALLGGAILRAFIHRGEFFDVGSPRGYLDANFAWLARQSLSAWTGLGARVEGGIELAGSVVGADATVTGGGALERCVIWPGSHARAPLVDAIVAGDGVVVAA